MSYKYSPAHLLCCIPPLKRRELASTIFLRGEESGEVGEEEEEGEEERGGRENTKFCVVLCCFIYFSTPSIIGPMTSG